ncbi:MAG: methyltransferase domain-containing protein [Woeseiaceae bacterium]
MTTNNEKPGALRPRDVSRRFDHAAATFDEVDFVHRHAATGLFERLSPMLVNAKQILDAGAATGSASRALAAKFKRSHVISLDSSMGMLRRGKKKRSRFAGIAEVQADAMRLPLQTGSIDLVFANMLLPWIDDLPAFFSGVGRVLRQGGLFVFSTLGPDSLGELRQAWSAVDREPHVHAFIDMHDVGDGLLRAGLSDPVLDVDNLTVTYRSPKALFDDLTRAGARNSLVERRHALTGKSRFRDMERLLSGTPGEASVPLSLELVFGHAWGAGPRQESAEYHAGEIRFDVSKIGRRSR